MRAVLIVNPNATSTTPAGRDLLAHALESRVKLTLAAGAKLIERMASRTPTPAVTPSTSPAKPPPTEST